MKADPLTRARRKADLVAASALLRRHAAADIGIVAGRADAWGWQIARLRRALAWPSVRLAGVALLALVSARRWLRRRPSAAEPPRPRAAPTASRWLDWAPVAWRLWRAGAPLLMRWLDRAAAGPR